MNPSHENIRASTLFLDANVLLEIILGGEKQELVKQLLEQQKELFCISALTAHLVVHFGQSRVGVSILRQFLNDYMILPLEATDFEWAFTNIRNDDFEDALQLAVAIRHGCSEFVTLDKVVAKAYATLPTVSVTLLS